MIGGILLIGLVIFGLTVLFGKNKPDKMYQFIIWLIFSPVLIGIAYSHLWYLWSNCPWWLQLIFILTLPLLTPFVLRVMFPNSRWLQELNYHVFQFFIYFVTFPFRLIWRSTQFTLGQERRNQRLNPYRPVVGGRPPLATNNRENRFNRNRHLDN